MSQYKTHTQPQSNHPKPSAQYWDRLIQKNIDLIRSLDFDFSFPCITHQVLGIYTQPAGLTPELTRAEHKAFKMKKPENDERYAIEASRLNELLGRTFRREPSIPEFLQSVSQHLSQLIWNAKRPNARIDRSAEVSNQASKPCE